jgi:uncharacterized protein (TIGR02147 family)
MTDQNMKSVYSFSSYREYLKYYYNEMKQAPGGFTFRAFAAKAGINAPATLLYVMEGKRGLTKSSAHQYANALGLSKRETEYFINLVFYDKAKTIKKKAVFLQNLMEMRKNIFRVQKDKYDFFDKWYHSAVRELVNIFPVKDNFKELGRIISPQISKSKARKSLELLERLEYIKKDENGFYRQTESIIQTGPVQDYAILKFQTEMLQKGLESFERLAKKDKMSSGTTFSISKETFEIFKEKARQFRKELLEIAKTDPNPERVYHMAISLFPLSRDKKRRTDV